MHQASVWIDLVDLLRVVGNEGSAIDMPGVAMSVGKIALIAEPQARCGFRLVVNQILELKAIAPERSSSTLTSQLALVTYTIAYPGVLRLVFAVRNMVEIHLEVHPKHPLSTTVGRVNMRANLQRQ
jgi:hypothetical protein